MAYREENNGDTTDIVIDGWENGISDDPYEGLADMRNVNTLSTPKEVAVGFSNTALSLPPTGLGTLSALVQSANFSYLAVGGGGGGGARGGTGGVGGGGGAGRVLTGSASAFVQAYSVTVGAGGIAGTGTGGTGGTGGSSLIGSLVTSIGGGGGGNGAPNGGSGTNGATGASGGGGGAAFNSGTDGIGGTGSAGSNGGNGQLGTSTSGAGGGGGAGTAGASAVAAGGGNVSGGNGGNGVASSISGSSVTYGGGGAGASGSASGTGGTGGGGNANTAGTVNTGGGGGGSTTATGTLGGTGIVVISYPTGSFTATGGTITTSGGNTIHTFLVSGTFTVTAILGYTTNTFTIASTAGFTNSMAILITASTIGGIANNTVYYVGSITSTTFQLFTTVFLVTPVTITSGGNISFTIPVFGKPVDSTSTNSNTFSSSGENYRYDFIVDDTGYIWYIANGAEGLVLNTVYFCGNIAHSTAVISQNIVAWKGYLFGLFDVQIDYIKISTFLSSGPTGNWTYAWKGTNSSSVGHRSIAATDDAMYFCNGTFVGSLLENPGSTFNPSSSGTYTYNDSALALPTYDLATCISQLGVTLLIGGITYYVYPWDRVSTSFNYPLVMAESFTNRIVSTNSNAFILAGKRGRIYITNGANIDEYKKFPDQLSGTENPYFTWGDALYFRNQLYFGISATTNAGVAITNFAGVWAIDLKTNALYLANSLSTGSYAGTVPVIIPMGNINPAGNALYIGWINGSNVGGIDAGSTSPYTNYEAYIDTDIIPIGTYFNPHTDQQIEYKLSKPLVAGESIRIAWRGNLTDSFTTVATLTNTGQISDYTTVNFQNQQWIQFRISMASTVSSPSYNKLREIRLR